MSVFWSHQRGVYAFLGRGASWGSDILCCHRKEVQPHAVRVWILNSTRASFIGTWSYNDVTRKYGRRHAPSSLNYTSHFNILCTAFVSINGDKFLRLSHHWKRNVSEMILNQGVIFTLPSFSSASKSKCSCWLTNLWLIASFGLGVTVTSLWMNRMWSISCSPQVKSDFAL